MGELRCVDGSVLSVTAIACRDRAGQPFEITLNLARDSEHFAAVGQRCGHQLALLADRVSGARLDPGQAAAWPDPDDRFPSPPAAASREAEADSHPEAGVTGHPGGYLPGEAEYFALRSRDRADLPGTGELRCLLRSSAVWVGDCSGTGPHEAADFRGVHGPPELAGQPGQHRGPQGYHVPPGQHVRPGQVLPGQRWPAVRDSEAGRGHWRLSRRAVIEAWGGGGIGVRAVLTSAELVAFLDTVLTEPELSAPAGPEFAMSSSGRKPGGRTSPYWRQRGRMPDAIARTRLPALRAQARGGAVAISDSQARRGDVRR
jgi:hypothetical protein